MARKKVKLTRKGCRCKQTGCKGGMCGCNRDGQRCQPDVCGCTGCTNMPPSVATTTATTTAPTVTPRGLRAASRKMTVESRIVVRAADQAATFIVPSDLLFSRLAVEAAQHFSPSFTDTTRHPVLLDASGGVCPPGLAVGLLMEALLDGVRLEFQHSIEQKDEPAAEDDTRGIGDRGMGDAPGTPKTPPAVFIEEKDVEEEESFAVAATAMTTPRMGRQRFASDLVGSPAARRMIRSFGAGDEFPGLSGTPFIATKQQKRRYEPEIPLHCHSGSSHGSGCQPGCLFVMGQGGVLLRVAGDNPFRNDTATQLFGQCVATSHGRVYECTAVENQEGTERTARFFPVTLPYCAVHSLPLAVASTDSEHVVVMPDGTLFCIGRRTPLPYQPMPAFRFTTVACCKSFIVAIEADKGRPVLWGDTREAGIPQSYAPVVLSLPVPDRHVTSVACGQCHVLLLLDDGSVAAFGCGDEGRLGLGDEESHTTAQLIPAFAHGNAVDEQSFDPVVAVSCGRFHSAAVTAGGALFTWGNGKFGQLGLGNQHNELSPHRVDTVSTYRFVDVACETLSTAALDSLGTVVTFGFRMTPPSADGYPLDALGTLPRIALRGAFIAEISACSDGFFLALRGSQTTTGVSANDPIDI